MTRKSKKKARIRARMAKQGVPYSVAARRDKVASTPATPTPPPTTVIVLPGRQLGLDAELFGLQCVAATKRGSRCRNSVEAHGQVARWDTQGRYRVDWAAEESFWLERYGSAEQLFNSYIQQRCKLHLDSDAPDATPPETYDFGPLIRLDTDVVDIIHRRVYPGMINLTRQELPHRQRDLSAEVAAAGADDMEPLLAVVATHPLPADAHIGPTEQPDPNCVNAPIWLGLLEAHHRGYLTTDQMRQCLIAGAPGLVDELS